MSTSVLNRNPGLDVLRSICLLLLILQHSFLFTDMYFPKFRMLWIISNSSLDLFFILSGFLIGGIIEKKYRENNSISFSDIFKFYKRRWFKTVPMYFTVILICLLLSLYNIYDAKDFSWKFLFFIQNLFRADFSFLPHTYSLTIEEWFYIFFPLVLYVTIKWSKTLKSNPFYIVIAIWIFTAIIIRLIKHYNGIENWDIEIRKTILTRIDATIYGVLFYFINLKIPNFIKKYRIILFCFGGIMYLFCTLVMNSKISLFFNNVIYYSIIPVFISFIMPFFMHLRLPIFFEKTFTFQSLASYSIYLIHLPLLTIVFKYFKPISERNSLILLIAYIVLSYLIGIIFYKLIEKPIMDLRDKKLKTLTKYKS